MRVMEAALERIAEHIKEINRLVVVDLFGSLSADQKELVEDELERLGGVRDAIRRISMGDGS